MLVSSTTTRLMPKISIVTPSFNQGQYLERTILSVLEQNYQDIEYIIIDGGSADNSVEIIKKYEKYLKYWVTEPDRGQSHAINKGFTKATGELFGWLNSDDYLVPGALATIADIYLTNPAAGAYVGAGEYVNGKGRVLLRKEPEEVSLESLYDWLDIFHFMQPSCFFTREAWLYAGGLDESIHYAMDLDLWFKIAKRFIFARTNKLLSRSLVHSSAKTKRHKYISEVDSAFVIMRFGGIQQARQALDNIANKLDYFEYKISPITGGALFNALLPTIKRIAGYNRYIDKNGGGRK